MAKKQKISRKQLLREPDEFITFSSKMLDLFKEHEKQVYIGIIVFFSLVILIAGLRWNSAKKEKKAFMQYDKAQLLLVQARQSGQNQGIDKVVQDLKNIEEKYSGTSAARLAGLTLGHVTYEKGDFKAAIPIYKDALKSFTDDPLARSMIKSGLAYCYEGSKEYKEAIKYFSEIIDDPKGVYKEDASYAIGRVYAEMGQMEKSKAAYKEFAKNFPDSIYARLAESRS